MTYAEAVKQLPPPLLGDTTVKALVYLWVRMNPGEHSARSLQQALGRQVGTALGELVRDGLLIEEEPPAGRRPGKYRDALESFSTPPEEEGR